MNSALLFTLVTRCSNFKYVGSVKQRPFQPWSIIKATIVVHYTQRNHLDQVRECEEEYSSFSDFTNFLRWAPDKAMMLGYTAPNEEVLRKSQNSNVRISIRYGLTREMDREEHFKDVPDLIEFLGVNGEIARALGYVKS